MKTEQYVSVPSGTGKTHLLTGLAVAACRQKRRVRLATAAALINEMVEAKHHLQLGRALARWARYDLIALDEVGYIPLAEVGAEFLFQVIAERAEKAAVTAQETACALAARAEAAEVLKLNPLVALRFDQAQHLNHLARAALRPAIAGG